jgi:hypothetical protein
MLPKLNRTMVWDLIMLSSRVMWIDWITDIWDPMFWLLLLIQSFHVIVNSWCSWGWNSDLIIDGNCVFSEKIPCKSLWKPHSIVSATLLYKTFLESRRPLSRCLGYDSWSHLESLEALWKTFLSLTGITWLPQVVPASPLVPLPIQNMFMWKFRHFWALWSCFLCTVNIVVLCNCFVWRMEIGRSSIIFSFWCVSL